MSVINQMLKDLDQRQQQHPKAEVVNAVAHASYQNQQTNKRWLLILVALLVIIATAIYTLLSYQNMAQDIVVDAAQSAAPVQQPKSQTTKEQTSNNSIPVAQINEKPVNKNAIVTEQNDKLPMSKAITNVNENSAKTDESQPVNQDSQLTINENKVTASTQANKALAENIPAEEEVKSASQVQSVEELIAEPIVPTLSIKKSDVSIESLIAKKWQDAQRAVDINQLQQAETAYQDILLLDAQYHDAREQLAALWFGRQQYTAALNVLSQGISIAPDYWRFRLMQAKIYLRQQQVDNAYQVLSQQTQVNDSEYLMTLANVAQQHKQYDSAILAYQRLSALFPNQSRWLLGLAIAYDSAQQYQQAILAYQQALNLTDLSAQSRTFIRQRLQVLGE